MTKFDNQIHTFHSGRPQPESPSKSSTFHSIDPATGNTVATIYTTTRQQLDDAIASAHATFPVWSQTPPFRRAAILLKAAAILQQRNDGLALTETLDTGKALSETITVDVTTGADVLEYYAHLAAGGFPGQHIRLGPDAFISTSHEPIGIYIEAGVPPGGFNVVFGDGPSVGAPKVASETVGKMKGITMELGGKSPLLILPDADVQETVDTAMMANFFSSGQACTNGTRVFVPTTLLSRVEEGLVMACRKGIRMGLPKDETTNFGPLVNKTQQDKVNNYIKHGREVDQARVLYDGSLDAQKERVVQQLDAGMTWINTWGESPAEMPVGGWKMSGVGLENGHEADIWALGCLIFYIVTKVPLFVIEGWGDSEHTNIEHMYTFIEMLGPLLQPLRESWSAADEHVNADGELLRQFPEDERALPLANAIREEKPDAMSEEEQSAFIEVMGMMIFFSIRMSESRQTLS
ncbi:uncharacterized protein KD926_004435 [Aspergillus affinis]|uniref:uncharacterized protein n=1 Tax=Aspergillus affinis TaxID=1070780 RepID=UPI0022FF36DE|nr:uncharacterized protein KD926_004435 [Aspergillus affinis]KAI9043251.1 hypothetical protein KD926_004435 [Aspergillus affinis]